MYSKCDDLHLEPRTLNLLTEFRHVPGYRHFCSVFFIYSTVAGAIERTWISGAIVFTAFGLLIGPVGLDLISFKADGETIRTLAELTLALVLFTDAAGADLPVLRKTEALPTRLLLIGLPMTIVLGFGVAALFFQNCPF